jgi:hypothetical protein
MATASFETNPVSPEPVLRVWQGERLELPNFRRSCVCEEDGIMSLLASVSYGFPIGELMTLQSDAAGTRHRIRSEELPAGEGKELNETNAHNSWLAACCRVGSARN